jgi:hypothetical protein
MGAALISFELVLGRRIADDQDFDVALLATYEHLF